MLASADAPAAVPKVRAYGSHEDRQEQASTLVGRDHVWVCDRSAPRWPRSAAAEQEPNAKPSAKHSSTSRRVESSSRQGRRIGVFSTNCTMPDPTPLADGRKILAVATQLQAPRCGWPVGNRQATLDEDR